MKIVRILGLLLLLPFLLLGCNGMGFGLGADNTPSGAAGDIHYHLVDLYAGYDVKVLISADNNISIEETKGPAAGDKRRIVSEITPQERATLNTALQGWTALNEYYATDLTPLVTIAYKDHRVSTSNPNRAPATFRNAKVAIDRIMVSLMQSANEKTRAATATAPANPPTP